MRYTIFNANGVPVKLLDLTLPEDEVKEALALNTLPEETAIEGDFSEGYYLDEQKALTEIPQAPSRYHEWDWATKAHTGPHFEVARTTMWQRVQAERQRRLAGGFLHAGAWWHSDEASRLHYLTNKDMARDQIDEGDTRETPLRNLATGEQVVWKALSGNVPMTAGLALDVAKAAKVHEAQVFATAEQHRAAVMASDDPYGYDFSAGWPAVFDGGET